MVQIKDILVQLDASPSDARLDVAIHLARTHGAHLVGLCAVDIARAAGLATGMIGSGNSVAVLSLVSEVRDEVLRETARLEGSFRERLRREGIEGEWRLAESDPASAVALHARYADFAVLAQPDPTAPLAPDQGRAVVEQALFSSGRPCLVVPYAGRFGTVGQRVLVGWNATREAARAVNDALPLLAGAKSVTVLAINPHRGVGGHGDVPAADIALHLARHGVRATAAHTTAEGISDADVLLNYASDISADLIVVGAYGHSRLRELVLGGVTRALLSRMTVPVLMSH